MKNPNFRGLENVRILPFMSVFHCKNRYLLKVLRHTWLGVSQLRVAEYDTNIFRVPRGDLKAVKGKNVPKITKKRI